MYTFHDGNKLFASSGSTFGSMGSSNRNPDLVTQTNRENFLKEIGIRIEDCVLMYQSHSDKVVRVDRDVAGVSKSVRADGIVTDDNSLALVITSADCVPIGFYENEKQLLGAVHAGWKGANLDIAGKAVQALTNLGGDPDKIEVVIGPAIAATSYVCENPNQVEKKQWQDFLKKTKKGYEVDVIGKNVKDLVESGIREEKILMSEIDTFTNEDFYSYRRHKSSVEMMWNVVAFRPLAKTR